MTSYGQLSAEFYALDKPEPPPDAFDFYERYARAAAGPIHEPMCGSGRYLLPLLAQSLPVSGSDSSSEMLALCRARADKLGITPQLERTALADLVGSYALVFIPSGSFGLLIDDDEVRQALHGVFGALAPGGTFLVEVERLLPAEPSSSGVWGGRWLERPDGAKLVFSWLTQYSGAANVTLGLHRYELVQDGRLQHSELTEFRVRSYDRSEFHDLLAHAGFTDIVALKPYQEEPADEHDDAFVFRCRRPAL